MLAKYQTDQNRRHSGHNKKLTLSTMLHSVSTPVGIYYRVLPSPHSLDSLCRSRVVLLPRFAVPKSLTDPVSVPGITLLLLKSNVIVRQPCKVLATPFPSLQVRVTLQQLWV